MLRRLILDLGRQPVADDLLDPGQPRHDAMRRLRLWVCDGCWLLQLDRPASLPTALHGHGSAFSSTILAHYLDLAEELVGRLELTGRQRVIDVASEAGYLLRPFRDLGVGVLGIEQDPGQAALARAEGIETVDGRLDSRLARKIVDRVGTFDVVLLNHTLAHATDVNDLLAACRLLLAPGGTLVVEFHHALEIVAEGQFDIVGHSHYTYWSLSALDRALARHGLAVNDARRTPIHGGSVVATATRVDGAIEPMDAAAMVRTAAAQSVLDLEREAGLDGPAGYAEVQHRAEEIRTELVDFLAAARSAGQRVVAYGAPGRGTTLLNFCGLGTTEILFTVDRSPAKQGRILPGCRIPVRAVSEIERMRPDIVLVLPWPLAAEIIEQNAVVRSWGGRFVAALPRLHELR